MTRLLSRDLDVVAELRCLMPNRRITEGEAHSVAERQALRLLELMHVDQPPIPMFIVSSLAGVTVDRKADWPTSGMAVAHNGGWRIVLKSSEPRQRQRFSLAHEFKHLLDDPYEERLYGYLTPRKRRERAEEHCDYFAASLMMPRAWIKRDFCRGIQRVEALARRYFVSTIAMRRRLADLGLAPISDHLLPIATHPAAWSEHEPRHQH